MWQKSYYDEVIRSQEHYNRAWKYNDENPYFARDDDPYDYIPLLYTEEGRNET